MTTWRTHHVEVHLFRRAPGGRANSISRYEFLLLRRVPKGRLGGAWQPVTGKAEGREPLWAAAAREVFEETGLRPTRWWALEHLTLYYEPASDTFVALPVFAAEIPAGAAVRLSAEHDAHAFASPAAAARRVVWDAQRAAIAAVGRELFAHPALSARARAAHPREITALVQGAVPAAVAASRRRRPRPARAAASLTRTRRNR